MKKIIITLSLMVAVLAQSFATEPGVTASTQKAFESQFARAKDVSWSQSGEFVIASFTQYGKKLYAYYNQSSELVVVAEPITLQALPAEMFVSLVEGHPDYIVSEVYKMKSDDGVRYHAVIENAKEKVFVNNSGEGWSITKKTKK
jgi:hypothetical protein